MPKVHITVDNFFRKVIASLNQMNKFGLDDAAVAAANTISALKTTLDGLNVHSTDKERIRWAKIYIDELAGYTTPLAPPSKPTLAGVGTGSGFTAGAGTYVYAVTYLDASNVESVASPVSDPITITNQDSVTVTYTNPPTGLSTVYIYRSNNGGVTWARVGTDTNGSPFSDTGAAGTVVSPPTTSTAVEYVYTDAKQAALTTFAGLIGLITAAANTTLTTDRIGGEPD